MKKLLSLIITAFFFTPVLLWAQENPTTAVPSALEGIKIGGLYRIRPEVKQNVGFNEGKSNTANYVGQKVQLSVSKHFNPNAWLKITLQDARIWGGQSASATALDTSREQQAIDLREAYLELKKLGGSDLGLQLGRQKLVYGNQRLVGHLDWTNIGRSFDGLRLKHETAHNKLHAWGTIVSEGNSSDVGQATANTADIFFSGIYNTYTGLDFLGIETYYLSKIDTSSKDSEKLHTVGARLFHTPKLGFDYAVEGAYQLGSKTSSVDISAFAGAAIVGFAFEAGTKMRLFFEGAYASGDTDANDDKFERFTNLYHTNHLHYGIADLISWQNMVSATLGYKIWFGKNAWLKVAYVYAAKAIDSDSWYGVAGGTATNNSIIANASHKKNLYQEIDVVFDYKIWKFLGLQAGAAVVLPGDAIKESGNRAQYLYSYFQTTAKF